MGRKIQMKKEPIRFTAAGDILITKKIPRENDGIAEISRYIKRGDIRMANLETTVTDGTCFASAFSGGTWLTVDKSCLWISKDMDLICWD